MTSSRFQYISVSRKNIFEGRAKLFTILCPGIGLYQGRKFYWSWSNGPLAASLRKWGISFQPLKKLTANGNR
jgi:hypothetical protein